MKRIRQYSSFILSVSWVQPDNNINVHTQVVQCLIQWPTFQNKIPYKPWSSLARTSDFSWSWNSSAGYIAIFSISTAFSARIRRILQPFIATRGSGLAFLLYVYVNPLKLKLLCEKPPAELISSKADKLVSISGISSRYCINPLLSEYKGVDRYFNSTQFFQHVVSD